MPVRSGVSTILVSRQRRCPELPSRRRSNVVTSLCRRKLTLSLVPTFGLMSRLRVTTCSHQACSHLLHRHREKMYGSIYSTTELVYISVTPQQQYL